mmetsp:Transcript_21452/g.28776  ORF Transcript_21452/g.28776 Transcript_21452/m.28776 type:complete len:137 (+) Transcript_21452:144-554(+)
MGRLRESQFSENIDEKAVREVLESKLDFLKTAGRPGCAYKLVGLKKAADIYVAEIDIPHGRKLMQQLPLTTKLTISNKERGRMSYALAIDILDNSTQKVTKVELKSSKTVNPGSSFTINSARPDRQPWRLNFMIKA